MATPYAFVTLVTSDSYLPGALALVASLHELHSSPPTPPEVEFQTVCLVTPETVDVSSIKLLRRAFDVVVGVEIIEQEDDKNLRLLGECCALSLSMFSRWPFGRRCVDLCAVYVKIAYTDPAPRTQQKAPLPL